MLNDGRDLAVRPAAGWLVQVVAMVILAPWLAGCTPTGSAILQTFTLAVRPPAAAPKPALNPQYRYLRLTTEGREVLLVLGYVDADPQGPVEVWYSAGREVIRLQGGRLVGAAGLLTEWRRVSIPVLPGWREMAAGHRWERSRDVMPGYRYGVRDQMLTRQIEPSPGNSLAALEPSSLLWFEERQINTPTHPSLRLPPARYAIQVDAEGTEKVVFCEQCLSPGLCFAWEYV